jgi:hypothetical protein
MYRSPVWISDLHSRESRFAASYGEFKLTPNIGYWLNTPSFSGRFLVQITFSVNTLQLGHVILCLWGILRLSRQCWQNVWPHRSMRGTLLILSYWKKHIEHSSFSICFKSLIHKLILLNYYYLYHHLYLFI